MLRKFFGTSHPWIMQAIGGGIAVIVMIPVAVYVAYQVFVQSPATAAAPRYHVPQQSQGAGNTSSPASAGNVVMMEPGDAPAGYVFSPSTLTVKAGTTVTWKDADTTAHNILGQGSAASLIHYGTNGPGTGPYKVTFSKPGTYHYQCTLHPGMVGQIIVK